MNRLPRFYHHGATEDLSAVIDHAIQKGYTNISLVGFSMGGSMSLKYLGEKKDKLNAISKISGRLFSSLSFGCQRTSFGST